MRFPKKYADTVARFRVPTGFVLVTVFAWLAQPTLRSIFWGIPISIAGLVLRAWAAGHLEKNTVLTTSGPYAWVRNPLYIGTFVTAMGLAIASKRPMLAWVFFLAFYFIYLPAIELEEQHLRKLFPEFSSYERKVRMLWPTLPEGEDAKAFDWKLYRKNEEYQAALGLLGGLAFLIWKATQG